MLSSVTLWHGSLLICVLALKMWRVLVSFVLWLCQNFKITSTKKYHKEIWYMSFDQNIISIRNWNSSDSGSICRTIKWRRPMIYPLHLTMKGQSQFLKDNGSRENKWICGVALKISIKSLDWSFPTKIGLLRIIKRVWI